MKKSILLMLLALPTFASAQLIKGTFFLGGSLSTTLQNTDMKTSPASPTVTSNNLGISPTLGWLIKENLAVGASLNYTTSLLQYDYYPSQSTKTESNSFGINPYIRYYFSLSSAVYFGLQGGLSFSRGNSKTTQTGGLSQTVSELPTYTLGVNLKPVLVFFPSPKWGIEASVASLGYNYARILPEDGSSNSFGFTAGSFSFGIAYYFIK